MSAVEPQTADDGTSALLAVIDIDGVVADVAHRLHHLRRTDAGRWGAFFRAAASDPLLAEGAALVAELATSRDIVWLTGRPEHLRPVTQAWLAVSDNPAALVTAGYFFHQQPREVHPAARSVAIQEGLLERCAELTGTLLPPT